MAKPRPASRPAATATATARHPRQGTVETGDHVFFQHHQQGPTSARVLAHGRDGFTAATEDGQRHAVAWDKLLGHKSRVGLEMKVIDAGQDGAVVEDPQGRRRFMAGDLSTMPSNQAKLGSPTGKADGMPQRERPDPLLHRLDMLGKALASGQPIIMLKADKIANAPGLVLRDVTDKRGVQTKRWMQSNPDQPAAPQMKHGDAISFQHEGVAGHGTIIASGRDGVTVRDDQGQTHQVRHDAISGKREPHRPDYAPRNEGEDDKKYLKRIKDTLPDPDHLPEDHGRYFNAHPDAQTVPMDKLRTTKTAEENQQGGNNSPKFMAAAYHGVVEKRDPINAEEQEDGTYKVTDGNGTLTGVQKHGWKSLPVIVTNAKVRAAEREAASLTTPEDAKLPKSTNQPVNTEEALFAKAKEGLEQLRDWLDRGNGVSSQMGHELMTVAPEDVPPERWNDDSGMLFIAPLKGATRAREKVMSKYKGDWSQLRDVVRCSIAVPTIADVAHVMDRLRASGMALAAQPDNRFANPTKEGYRDFSMNIRLPNGMLAEVQLHAKPMMLAKNEGHHWYEIQRSIDAKTATETREKTPEEREKLNEALHKQQEIYGKAWRAVAGEKDEGTQNVSELKKSMGSMARGMAAGAERATAKAAPPKYDYFRHEGAKFRRSAADPAGGVEDILFGDKWERYTGSDRLKCAMHGTPIEDPLAKAEPGDQEAGAPEQKPMMKAIVDRLLFRVAPKK